MIIGPNPCHSCGGEYGQHTSDCQYAVKQPLLKSILSFWRSFDDSDGLERTVKFDACDREKVSRELAKRINADDGLERL